MSRRAVFLDRDGVLNHVVLREGKPYPPAALEQLEIIPGVEQACRDLRAAGFALIMVTNQPDVARGTQTREVVESINQAISEVLFLDDVKVCYHDDADNCDCRKPKPGLLLAAAREQDIDLPLSFMVGDRWKDIEAGRRANCKTILVSSNYSEKKAQGFDAQVQSLSVAADWILQRTHLEQGEHHD